MATKHTTNYQLNLWEAKDEFRRTEFNENTQKLDTALGALAQKVEGKADTAALTALQQKVDAKASASALNALSQKVEAKGNCQIVTGSYTGTGTYGQDRPTALDFTASMGRAPLFICVAAVGDGFQITALRGVTYQNTLSEPDLNTAAFCHMTWTETGLSWYNRYNAGYQLNQSGKSYFYIALFD